MPTPTGLLKRGDRIQHTETGVVLQIVERLGNDINYSVRVRREDGQPMPDGRATKLVLEVGYWLQHGRPTTGGPLYVVLGERDSDRLVDAVWKLLDVDEWSPDTLQAIMDLFVAAGFKPKVGA